MFLVSMKSNRIVFFVNFETEKPKNLKWVKSWFSFVSDFFSVKTDFFPKFRTKPIFGLFEAFLEKNLQF